MAIGIATEIALLVIEFGKLIWVPIKRQASYLFCYGRNVETFRIEVSNLESKVHEVLQDVDEAHRRGDTICVEVEWWLKNAENMKSDAQRLVDGSTNTKCWKGSCWTPILWYGLGKEAAEKMISVVQLRNEGNFVRVSCPPPPPRIECLLPNRDFKALPSTEKPINRVLDALQDDGINIIGVHGMGGVGKTTLIKEVAKQAKEQKLFNKVVMVTVSQNIVIKKIQDDIRAFLGIELKEKNELMRACMLSERLKMGKSLVILDDLWDILDLCAVGIPYGGEHDGCKLIITSRNLDVCRRMRSQAYIEVEALPEEESWTLFNAYAGGVVNSNELFEVARNIVKECKGLPLAVRVLGLALRDKNDVTVWNAMLRKLRSSTPTAIPGLEKEVFEIIKYSFDHLGSEEAKLCFLFCCLFPEDANISLDTITWFMVGEELIELTETLDEAEEEVSLYMDSLKTSGLLLEGRFEGQVMMHDVVHDVAIWIAEKTYGFYSRPRAGLMEWPSNIRREECQRLSLQKNEINVLPGGSPRYPNLHILLLANNDYLEMIPDNFFSEMKALKVLDICRTEISSLPTSLSGLTNLKVLDVRGCEKLRCLSGIGALKSLEILHLSDKVGINVLPIEVAELSNLRFLNLSKTNCMIPSNVISQLSRLEQLHMTNGFNEWQAQGSEDINCAAFAELACLSRLRALSIDVKDERCFLQDLGDSAFQKLERFKIRCLDQCLHVYVDHINNQEDNFKVRIVNLVVPDWVKLLAGRANWLALEHCPGVECLGDGEWDTLAKKFSGIETFELYEMSDLHKLYDKAPPNAFLGCLKKLIVQECHKLTNIFSSHLMSSAHQLQVLQVDWCDQLSHVFHNVGALEGKSHNPILLPQLKELGLYALPKLTSIWEGGVPPQSLGLQRLSITECLSLKHVLSPALAVALEQLEELEIQQCEQLEKLLSSDLPGKSKSFLGLKKLRVYKCARLISLFSWGQVRSLELLEELTIIRCRSMVAIIMSEEEKLEIQALKDSTSMLPRLREVYLEDLEIASFDKEGIALFDWPSLESICIENCPNLKRLPLTSSSAPKLHCIHGSEAWFQELEWEDESIKSQLQTFFGSTSL